MHETRHPARADVDAHRAPSRGALTVALLALHAAIHVMGFAKAFELAELAQLTAPISRGWGVVWLACALSLLAAAALRLVGSRAWWMLGAPAVVASQLVIAAFWTDAKVGTVANALLVLPLALGFGRWRFARRVERALARLGARAPATPPASVDLDDLAALPPVIAAWLQHAGVVGRPRARAVHVRQRGELQKSPGGAWLPFRAQQWFAVPEPAFVWVVDVHAGPGLSLAGADGYLDGRGSMRIELASLWPVVDASGPFLDQGALVRFLAEIMWFPSAALEPYLRWQAIDERTARASIRWGELEASGVFRFDAHGDVVGFEAKRYRDDRLEDWLVDNDPTRFAELDGVRVPTRSTITWRSESAPPWTWLRLDVVSIERQQEADAWAR